MDCSPPCSCVHGILQARKLEWVAISFSRGSSPPRDQTHISCLAGGVFTTEPPGKPMPSGLVGQKVATQLPKVSLVVAWESILVGGACEKPGGKPTETAAWAELYSVTLVPCRRRRRGRWLVSSSKGQSEASQSTPVGAHREAQISCKGRIHTGQLQAKNMIQLQLTPEMFGCSAKGSVGCKGHGPGEENLDGCNPACRINPNRSKERQETERTQYGMRLWIQPSLTQFSLVQFFATLWTIVCQAPLSMGFSGQEYWSGLPCPLPGELPNPMIEPTSPASLALQADLYRGATGATWIQPRVKPNPPPGFAALRASIISFGSK